MYAPTAIEDRFRERLRLHLLREASRFLTAWLVSTPILIGATARTGGVWQWRGGRGESIDVVSADGFAVGRLAFDGDTGLPCRLGFQSGVPFVLGTTPTTTKVPAEWEFLDYRVVDDIRIAHHIVMRLDGKVDREIRVHAVEINRPLPADFFHPGTSR
jgi:hypothetical protein